MEGLQTKYFVLNPSSNDPTHAEASRKAMEAYAQYVGPINPQFAHDIYGMVLAARAEEQSRYKANSVGAANISHKGEKA